MFGLLIVIALHDKIKYNYLVQNRFLNLLKYLLGWPFSILAFIFILRLIIPKIPEFTSNIQNLNLSLLFSGITSFILFYFTRSYIWHILVKMHSKDISYRKSSYLWAISELKRYIPGNVWGFLGRTLLFSDLGITKKEVGKLILVEAGLFVVGAAVISLLSLPFIGRYLFSQVTAYQPLIIILVFLLVAFYVFCKKPIKIFMDFQSNIKMQLVFLSTIAVFFSGLGYYFVISAFILLHPQLIFQLTGFFVLSFVIGALSFLTPAGFGVREGLMIGGLSKIITVTQSAFGVLFARVVLIFSELLFIFLAYLWHKTRHKKLTAIEDWIAGHKHETALIFLTLLYIIYFTIVSFLRHDNFYTGRFDLGNMAQTVWNTTQGRIFMMSNPNSTEAISRLAFHADFQLVLLAPIYALFPSPKTLLFIQALVVGAGSFYIYQIAKETLNNKNIALSFAFLYLINPSLQRANLYDFHPVTLVTTFLLGMYYFYSKKKYIWFVVFALLAGISKEQIWAIVALFGVLLFFRQKKRIFGASVFVFSSAMFYYLISIAIPNTLGANHFALSYYSDLGDGPLSILKTIIFSPEKIIDIIFQKEKVNYLVQLFAPVGYLPVVYPFFLVFAGPDFLINLLSNNAQLHQIYYQYTAAITPFIFISSIFGIKALKKHVPSKYSYIFVVYIIAAGINGAYNYGPLPGSISSNLDMFTKQAENREQIEKYLSDIPEELSVAASNNLGAHLSHRQFLYTLPHGATDADVLVYFLNDSEQPEALAMEKKQVENLKHDKSYKKTAEIEEFVVFRKK